MRSRPFVPPRRFQTTWLLACLLAAATLPGCSPEPEPKETYLGEFWIQWSGSSEYTVTRMDLGEGIYEDRFRRIHPSKREEDGCTIRTFSDTLERTYRGLVLLAEWIKVSTYNSCSGIETVGEWRSEYAYAPYMPQEIHQALMAGESFDTPIQWAVEFLGYDCADETEPCTIERAIKIPGEDNGTEVIEEIEDYDAVPWKWRGESLVEHAAGTSKTLVFNRIGRQRWYDISREVIVLGRAFAEPGDSTPGHVIAADHDGNFRAVRLGGPRPDVGAAHWARQWAPELRSRP